MVDAERLGQLTGSTRSEQVTPRRLVIVAPDAASATPAVVSAVEATGVSVTSIETTQPSFDEVFVRLVERTAGDLPGDAETGDATRPSPSDPAAAADPPGIVGPRAVEDVV